jgi:nucleotide-binding universal stress UspA family protein
LIYRKILVPYDISKPADAALEHASKIAKASQGKTEIILLHVIPEIPIYPVVEQVVRSKDSKRPTFEEHIRYVYSALKEDVTKLLDEKKYKYEQEVRPKKIRTEVSLGKPVDKILEYAKSEEVELIIMGSAGLSGIGKLVLGSVSKGVLERAKCPVMIVH